MLKLINIVLCLYLLVNTTYAAQAIQRKVPTPPELACEEGCYSTNLKIVLPYEESYFPPDTCLEYLCQNNGDIYIFSCGAVEAGGDLEKVAGDPSLPYPHCCDTVRRKEE